jgi:hypothetical protein
MHDANSVRPLAGMRVLEMGQLLAGPFAGHVLAYFGAEVIKIEPPDKGDPIRSWRLLDAGGTSHWWRSLGRNKKCITLNLHTARGRAIARQLADRADVLIENFRPGTMEKWGLGPADLKTANPGLIYSRISGYGQTGPYAARPGFASVCEGIGGFRYLNGFPGQPPVRPNLSIGDTLAGMHAVLGILMAYIHRAKPDSGQGQVVDVAIYEAVFNMLEAVVPDPACANCHKVLDPIGFGLENFDAIGRWRDQDDTGGVIDAAGELPGGKRFTSPKELKAIIAARTEDLARNVTEKLLAYALCRQLEGYDEIVVDHLVETIARDGYRMQTLITEIVTSYPFTHRRIQEQLASNEK